MSSEHSHDPHKHDEIDHHHVAKHVRAYLMVGAALLVFTIITVALSYIDFGAARTNISVALLVAAIKAGLVAFVFMHLNSERPLIYRVLIFTFFFVVGLFILTLLAFKDGIPAQI